MVPNGESASVDSSPVVGGVTIYIAQSVRSREFKIGKALDERAYQRLKEHSTAGGEMVMIACARNADAGLETALHRLFRSCRHTVGGRELFRPAPKLMRFPGSPTARHLGFVLERKPVPLRQTWRQYLREMAQSGCLEAAYFLSEEARLRRRVPAESRGGWDSLEIAAGTPYRQLRLPIDGLGSHGVSIDTVNGWLCHLVTYCGARFLFPIFAEACRYYAKRPPIGAVETGVTVRGRYMPSGRAGKPLRKKPAATPTLPTQAALSVQLELKGTP